MSGDSHVAIAKSVEQRVEPGRLPPVRDRELGLTARREEQLQDAAVVGVRHELEEALSCGSVDEWVGSLSRDTEHAGYVGDGQTVVRMRDGFDDAPRRVGANDLLAMDAASVGDRFGRRRNFAAEIERGVAPAL